MTSQNIDLSSWAYRYFPEYITLEDLFREIFSLYKLLKFNQNG
jgi:hypothetical protein